MSLSPKNIKNPYSSLYQEHFPYIILTLSSFIYFITVAWLKHYSFHSSGLDMAVFDQVYYNTINGNFWQFSLESQPLALKSYFANHFSPFLLLLIPFYWIWSSPGMLILAQSLALSLGSIPLYLFALDKIKNKAQAFIITMRSITSRPLFKTSTSMIFTKYLFSFHFLGFASTSYIKKTGLYLLSSF